MEMITNAHIKVSKCFLMVRLIVKSYRNDNTCSYKVVEKTNICQKKENCYQVVDSWFKKTNLSGKNNCFKAIDTWLEKTNLSKKSENTDLSRLIHRGPGGLYFFIPLSLKLLINIC